MILLVEVYQENNRRVGILVITEQLPSLVMPLPQIDVSAASAWNGISFMCVRLPLMPFVPPKFISAVQTYFAPKKLESFH